MNEHSVSQILWRTFVWDPFVVIQAKKLDNRIRYPFYVFVQCPAFNTFIMALVLINTIFMALDRFPEPGQME